MLIKGFRYSTEGFCIGADFLGMVSPKGVFRTLSKICDGAFYKNEALDVGQGSDYTPVPV